MSLQKFARSDVVVTCGKGRVNSDSFTITIKMEIQTTNAVVTSNSIQLRP